MTRALRGPHRGVVPSPPLRGWLAAAALLLLPASALADVFVLKDGRRIEGVLVKEEKGVLTVKTGVGEISLARADVQEILSQKTAAQEFEERFSKARSAEEFFQAGEFATSKKMKREAQKAWKQAITVDPDHVPSRTALGFVRYRGQWLTPEARDVQQAADEAAEMAERGLVRYQDRWVTPEDKSRLEQGLVLVDGKWIPFAEVQRSKGLEEFAGEWLPRELALARRDLAGAEKAAGLPLEFALGSDCLVAGPFPKARLELVVQRLGPVRGWFDAAWRSTPGLGLFGGRLAEIYAFGREAAPFQATISCFAALTNTLPSGWAEAVAGSHGFFFVDPFPLSSARQWHRGDEDLTGHCLHHWGHLLLGRLGYDGRLLPPWYEEAVACHSELVGHGRNAVFCRGTLSAGQGTSAGGPTVAFSAARFRDGEWRAYLKAAFEQKAVPGFDKLAQVEFGNIEIVDIAAGMAVVEWLKLQKDGGGLRAFHDVLRRGAPKSPERVIRDAEPRHALYDRAFQAAAGLDWRAADQAWRKWFLSSP
ncbi:MAG: hypothetical protein IPK67_12975 [Planctomycetes bacterium]|nr:hypothetical protein [Planctomycetota bacterium]